MARSRKRPRRLEKPARTPTEPAAAAASASLPPGAASVLLIAGTVVAVATLGAEIWLTDSRIGLPLDDAFIHLRFAENLARGEGFAFNPGDPLPATTSPLWVLLLAVPALFGANLLAAAKILSVTALVLAGLAAGRLTHRLVRRVDIALLAGLGTLLAGRLVWAAGSGMETLAFAAASLFAVERALARERARTRADLMLGALFGAAALLRPEGILLFGLWLAFATVHSQPPLLRVPPLFVVAGFAALCAPWVIFCLATTGSPFPTTFTAKRVFLEREPGWMFLARHLRELFESNPLLCIAYPVGLFVAARAAVREPAWRLVAGWALALPVAAAILLPVQYHHGRYLMPILPFELLLGAVGAAWLWGKLPLGGAAQKPLVRIAFVLVIAGGAYGAVRFAMKLGANVAEITQLHVRMGAWARAQTPKESLIAAGDIGALGYLGDRRILDLGGLVTPEVVPLIAGRRLGGGQDDALFPVLARERPGWLVVYPDWYPHLTARPDLFEPVALAKSDTQTIAGGRLLVAYRAHWDRYTPAPPLALSEAATRLGLVRGWAREGRNDEAWSQLAELEARGPLDRGWRRLLYVVRAEVALARGDCNGARKSLVFLDWLTPPESFRRRERVDGLEARARSCRTK